MPKLSLPSSEAGRGLFVKRDDAIPFWFRRQQGAEARALVAAAGASGQRPTRLSPPAACNQTTRAQPPRRPPGWACVRCWWSMARHRQAERQRCSDRVARRRRRSRAGTRRTAAQKMDEIADAPPRRWPAVRSSFPSARRRRSAPRWRLGAGSRGAAGSDRRLRTSSSTPRPPAARRPVW